MLARGLFVYSSPCDITMLARAELGLFVYSSPCDITMLARAELGLFVYSSPCDNVNDMYKK